MMGLTMSQRQAVAKTIATRYKRASRAEEGAIGHVAMVWDPARQTTIEALDTADGVGHFSYAGGPSRHIFEIWRVGNVADTPSRTA